MKKYNRLMLSALTLAATLFLATVLPFFQLEAKAATTGNIKFKAGSTETSGSHQVELVVGSAINYSFTASDDEEINGSYDYETSINNEILSGTGLSCQLDHTSESSYKTAYYILSGTPTTTGTYNLTITITSEDSNDNLIHTSTGTLIVKIYSTTPPPAPSPTPAPTPASSTSKGGTSKEESTYADYHDHAHNGNTENFVWEQVNEATEYSDGKEVYRCPDCGYVLYSVPVSAYSVFNKTSAARIAQAPAGGTVTIEARQWVSFHKMVLDALKNRSDVTLIVNFRYNENYTLTIPAGTDLSGFGDDENFIGFLRLAELTGCLPEIH